MAEITFSSPRTTTPDIGPLVASVRAAANDAAADVAWLGAGAYRVRKGSAFTGPEIAAVQAAIDAAPEFDQSLFDVDQKVLRAVVMGLWEAIPAPTLTKVQLRTRILQIYRSLT